MIHRSCPLSKSLRRDNLKSKLIKNYFIKLIYKLSIENEAKFLEKPYLCNPNVTPKLEL